jgi:hypothetical protein
MAEETIKKINIDTSGAVVSIGKLRDEFIGLQDQIDSFDGDRTSDAFKQLTQDLKRSEKALEDGKAKLDDYQDTLNTVRGSGVERLQTSFGLLTESVKNVDFGKAKVAFRGLGNAMKALPIFLIIGAVTALIENFDNLKSSGGLVGQVFTAIGDTIDTVLTAITDLSDAIGLTDSKAAEVQANADARNKAAIEERIALVEKVRDGYKDQIAIAKAAGQDTTDLEKKSAAAQRQILETNIAYLENIAKQSTFFADVIGPVLEGQKQALADLTQEENVQQASRTRIANEQAQKRADEAAAIQKKADEDAAKEKAKQDAAEIAEAKRIETEKLKAEEAARKEFESNIAGVDAGAEAQFIDGLSPEDRILAESAKTRNELIASFDALSDADKLARKSEFDAAFISLNEQTNRQLAEEQAKQTEASIQLSQAERDAKIDLASQGLSTVQSLVDLFAGRSRKAAKTAFNVNKALGIAQASISTYQSAVSAYQSQLTIPSPDAPVRAAVAAGIAIAAGLANVAKIASTKFNDTGASSGGSGSLPSAQGIPSPSASTAFNTGAPSTTPALNLFGTSNASANNITGADPSNPSGQVAPIRAYVTQTDIESTQQTVDSIRRRNEL